jgi:hypothetical protein
VTAAARKTFQLVSVYNIKNIDSIDQINLKMLIMIDGRTVGTTNSLAPSEVDLNSVGVSTSMKSELKKHYNNSMIKSCQMINVYTQFVKVVANSECDFGAHAQVALQLSSTQIQMTMFQAQFFRRQRK